MRNPLVRRTQVRGVRRTREEIAQVLADYHVSSLSQSAFARSNGISQPTLSYWLRTSRRRNAGNVEDAPRLVPVKVTTLPTELSPPTRPGFELDLPSSLRLWIPANFDEDALRRLLPILTSRC